jgi:uncharacterized membrane protein
MKGYVTAGLTVLAGVALFEAALIPAVMVGGAAVLAPKVLPRLRRGAKRTLDAKARRRAEPGIAGAEQPEATASPAFTLAGFGVKQAIAKTITFRIIVTTLDFTTNYVVIGELTTAAGLSTFNLIVGPLFYLSHEAAWNYLGPAEDAVVEIQLPARLWGGTTAAAGGRAIKISRALAKTITFRTLATIMDFTVNYVVVRDVVTAAGLSAFAFVVGPFVYLGHEKVWDYYSGPRERTLALPAPKHAAPTSA